MSSRYDDIIQIGGKPALLFIPDISGFTKFIHNTDVIHSTHIISELIELIIDSVALDLKAIEIEGDAVFFYREGPPPTWPELQEMTFTVFTIFKKQLKRYETDRVCSCGACTTANELTLKFFIHYGPVLFREIRGLNSLMGPDVTVAHRLMKNDVPSDEYILVTDDVLAAIEKNHGLPEEARSLSSGEASYESIGEVRYRFLEFDVNQLDLSLKQEKRKVKLSDAPLTVERTIRAPLERIRRNFLTLGFKKHWQPSIDIKYDDTKISRVGTPHICVTPLGDVNFETYDVKDGNDSFSFSEFAEGAKVVPPSYTIFSVSPTDEEGVYKISQESHIQPGKWIQNVFIRFLKGKFLQTSTEGLDKFIELTEKDEIEVEAYI